MHVRAGGANLYLPSLAFTHVGEMYVADAISNGFRTTVSDLHSVRKLPNSKFIFEFKDKYGHLYRADTTSAKTEGRFGVGYKLFVQVQGKWWKRDDSLKDDFKNLGVNGTEIWVSTESSSAPLLIRDGKTHEFMYSLQGEGEEKEVFSLDPMTMETTGTVHVDSSSWNQFFPHLSSLEQYFWSIQSSQTGREMQITFQQGFENQISHKFNVNWIKTESDIEVPTLTSQEFPGFVLDTSIAVPRCSKGVRAYPFVNSIGHVKFWLTKELVQSSKEGESKHSLLGEWIDYNPDTQKFVPSSRDQILMLALALGHSQDEVLSYLRDFQVNSLDSVSEELLFKELKTASSFSTRDSRAVTRALIALKDLEFIESEQERLRAMRKGQSKDIRESIDQDRIRLDLTKDKLAAVFKPYLQWRGRGGGQLLTRDEDLKILEYVAEYFIEHRDERMIIESSVGLAARLGGEELLDIYEGSLAMYLPDEIVDLADDSVDVSEMRSLSILMGEDLDVCTRSLEDVNEYPTIQKREFDQYFVQEDLDQSKDAKQLETLLRKESVSVEDPLTYRKVQGLCQDLHTYGKELKHQYRFSGSPDKTLVSLRERYAPQLDQELRATAAIKHMIELLIPEDAKAEGVTVELLLIALAGKRIDILEDNYPFLDIEKVQKSLGGYLRASRRVARIKQVLNRIDHLAEQLDNASPETLYAETQELVKSILAHPQFSMKEFPELAVMEYFTGFTLYEEQVKGLKTLLNGAKNSYGAILEMIMASGKSAVLAPLFSLMMADGEFLSSVVVKDSLMEEMLESLEKTLGKSFARLVQKVSFSRQSDCSVEGLQSFYDQLDEARSTGTVLLMTPSTYNAIYLKYLEMLSAEDRYDDEQVSIMRSINALLLSKRRILMDEADSILSIDEDTNFSIGAKQELYKWERDLSKYLVFAVRNDGNLSGLIQMDLQDSEEAEMFSDMQYKDKVVPILADYVMEYLSFLNDFQDEFSKLTKEQEKDLKAFLCGEGDEGKKTFLTLSHLLQKHFALAKGQIQIHLRIALKKKLGRDYGMGKNGIAIPYKNIDEPKELSSFANHHLTYDLTLFMYLSQGLSKEYFKEKIEELQNLAREELESTEDLESTVAYTRYLEFLGIESEEKYTLFAPDAIERAMKKVNGNDSLLFQHVDKEVLKNIGYFAEEVVVSPVDMPFLSQLFEGFTGTLNNPAAYSHILDIHKQKGTEGKILSLLWAKNHENFRSIDLTSSGSIETLVSQIFKMENLPENMQALADPGGYFRKGSSEDVAREILRQDQEGRWKGVAFYDSKGNKLVLEKGEARAVPFKKSRLKPEERLTFYAQANCTGADIAQAQTASMLILLGDHSLQALEQTLFRMRKIDQSQSSMIVMSKDLEKLIRKESNLEEDESISLLQVLIYLLSKEGDKHGRNNIQTQILRMESVLKARIVNILVDESLEIEEARQLLADVHSLFWRSNSEDVIAKYATPNRTVKAHEYVDQVRLDLEERLKLWHEENTCLKERVNLESLLEEMRSVVSYEDLPNEMTLSGAGLDDADRTMTSIQETENIQEHLAESEQVTENLVGQGVDDSDWGNREPAVYFTWKSCDLYIDSSKELPIFPKSAHASNDIKKAVKKSLPTAFEANNVIQYLDELDSEALIFDPALELSYNFQSARAKGWNPKLFDRAHNWSKWVLVDTSKDQKRIVALDASDVAWIKELLEKIRKKSKDFTYAPHFTLYNLDLGVVDKGRKALSEEELLSDDKVMLLLTQFKFLQGEIRYSKAEIKALKSWGEEVGFERLRMVFEEHILPLRPELKKPYFRSKFSKLLMSKTA